MTTNAASSFPGLSLPDSLHAERLGDIAVLRLSRPTKRNALNMTTVLGIRDFFQSLPDDVRAVVVHGEGTHFCAGLDLNEVEEQDVDTALKHSRTWHHALDQVQFGRVPVVAVLHGAVVGGGLELAASAHIRVSEPSTFYGLPEGQRGIFVGGGGAARIPRLIGVARMTDLMLTGRVYRAEEGHQAGLAQYLVGEGAGLEKGIELARKMASNAPMSNYAVMHALPRIAEQGQDQGLFMEALMASIACSTPEAKARVRMFLNKQAGKVGE